jgi:hypothetical protein
LLVLILAACAPDHSLADVAKPHSVRNSGDDESDPTTQPDDTVDSGTDASGDTGASAPEGSDDTTDDGTPDWTVLVFANGDNDLESWALADFNEMEQIGSTDRVNVVVQMDRGPQDTTADGDWVGARRFLVEADADTQHMSSPVVQDLGKIDSGSPQTVIDFATWGVQNYPAKHYMLVMWDHGAGWTLAPEAKPKTKALSYDDDAGTVLSVANGDLETILDGVTAATGQPLDVLGMDACVMQTWEVAHIAAKYAKVYVASEDYEDVKGWPYDTVLADLTADPTMDAATLGGLVAKRFHEVPDSTMSAIDLAGMPALDAALDTLADTLIASGQASRALPRAANASLGFDGDWSVDHDLGDLLARFADSTDPDVKAAAQAAQAAYEPIVLASYTYGRRVKAATGLTIYSPADGYVDSSYLQGSWSADSRWDDFLLAGANVRSSGAL